MNETPLDDDYLVNWDYFYVADGKVIRSDIKGNIADLKRDLKSRGISCKVITSCNIAGRMKRKIR